MKTNENPVSLRVALGKVTKSVSLEKHAQAVANLKARYAHGIELVARWDARQPFTCIQHGLGLEAPPAEVVALATMYRDDRLYISPGFVGYLIAYVLEEAPLAYAEDGDILVYMSRGAIKHLGLVQQGRVLSKWGRGNHWSHSLLEVPRSYGTTVRVFRPIPVDRVITAFVAYARTVLGDDLVNSVVGCG